MWARIAGLGVALWLGLALDVAAQTRCRLALVLALDVSSSVDAEEYVLQRNGVSAALDDPMIRSAILDADGHVALSIYEWSGRRQSTLIVPWTALTDDAAIDEVIETLMSTPRSHYRFPTAMGYALGFGATLLARGPQCDRKVIDLSGDGENNDGFSPRQAYAHFPFSDVTVNGLAVLGGSDDLVDYFQREVRFGFGAFVETSDGYVGYRDAITRKLFRELNDRVLSAAPVDDIGPG